MENFGPLDFHHFEAAMENVVITNNGRTIQVSLMIPVLCTDEHTMYCIKVSMDHGALKKMWFYVHVHTVLMTIVF